MDGISGLWTGFQTFQTSIIVKFEGKISPIFELQISKTFCKSQGSRINFQRLIKAKCGCLSYEIDSSGHCLYGKKS